MNAILRLCFLIFLMICAGGSSAEGEAPKGIVFLRLALDQDGIRVLDAAVRPGVLKEPRTMPHPLVYRLISGSGEVLHTGTLPDPRLRRIESVPRQAVPAREPVIRANSAEFLLRVPYLPEARQIEVFERAGGGEETPGTPGKGRKPVVVPVGKRLGGTAIPLTER